MPALTPESRYLRFAYLAERKGELVALFEVKRMCKEKPYITPEEQIDYSEGFPRLLIPVKDLDARARQLDEPVRRVEPMETCYAQMAAQNLWTLYRDGLLAQHFDQ